jgi:hypothetical protein
MAIASVTDESEMRAFGEIFCVDMLKGPEKYCSDN